MSDFNIMGTNVSENKNGNGADTKNGIEGQIDAAEQERSDAIWQEEAKGKLLNLSTSNADVLDFIMETAGDPNVSPARQQALNYLISLRTQMVTMLSNIMRTIFDGGNSIIRNMRA